jgi:hypothetical protein
MMVTKEEYALDSRAIGVGAAIRDTGRVDSEAYARMRSAAKEDAELLLLAATSDDDEQNATARKRIVLHLGVNQLAQVINYHAMIHAKLVIDADSDEAYARCPVCRADIP